MCEPSANGVKTSTEWTPQDFFVMLWQRCRALAEHGDADEPGVVRAHYGDVRTPATHQSACTPLRVRRSCPYTHRSGHFVHFGCFTDYCLSAVIGALILTSPTGVWLEEDTIFSGAHHMKAVTTLRPVAS